MWCGNYLPCLSRWCGHNVGADQAFCRSVRPSACGPEPGSFRPIRDPQNLIHRLCDVRAGQGLGMQLRDQLTAVTAIIGR